MELSHAVVLAIVQGLTEFFPVSSSAHLILVPSVLGWQDQGLDFDLGVHVGSLIAIILWFRKDLASMFHDVRALVSQPFSLPHNLVGQIIIATVPVLIVGFFASSFIEQHLRSGLVIAVSTAFFAIVLWLSGRNAGHKEINQMNFVDALFIGCAQVLALIPGTSRSGITMSAASFRGYTIETAARFSFLLSIPTIALAGLYLVFKLIREGTPIGWQWVAIGALLSGIAAWIGIGFCLAVLKRLGYKPFVLYRLFLAAYLVFVFI